MNLQGMGAICIVVGCGGVGFGMALNHKREERALEELKKALEFMGSDLQYRLTPLPELCRRVSEFAKGSVGAVFGGLSRELDKQLRPDAESCMASALQSARDLPGKARTALEELGRSLGQFDLEGQVRGIALVEQLCEKELAGLAENRTQRLRSYQTLGLCAGAALAILFM